MPSSTFLQLKPSLPVSSAANLGRKQVAHGATMIEKSFISLSLIFLFYRMCCRNQSHWTQGCCENLKKCVNISTNEKRTWVDCNLLLVTDPYFLTKPTVGAFNEKLSLSFQWKLISFQMSFVLSSQPHAHTQNYLTSLSLFTVLAKCSA